MAKAQPKKKPLATQEAETATLPPEAPAAKQALVLSPVQKAEMEMIERAVNNPRTDVKKMKELLAMRKELRAEEAVMAFNTALCAAQAEIQPIVRDKENDHTKSWYAKLESMDAIIRPIYAKHGFALFFNTERGEGNWLKVSCRVSHIGGHVEIVHGEAPFDDAGAKGTKNKTGVQAFGATNSYLQRYITRNIFNVVFKDEDNDGNGEKPPAGDPFKDKITQQAARGAVSDASYEEVSRWDGSLKTPGSVKTGFKTPNAAAQELIAHLKTVKNRKEREDTVMDNLPLLHALAADKSEAVVKVIHKTAEKGGA